MQYKIRLIKDKKAETFKKGLLKKIPLALAFTAAIAGLGLVEKETRTQRQFVGTYQGYSMSEGVPYFVFDRDILKNRGKRSPENVVVGRYNLTKELEIGRDYSVKTQRPGIPIRTLTPLGPGKIVSIEPYDSDNSEER